MSVNSACVNGDDLNELSDMIMLRKTSYSDMMIFNHSPDEVTIITIDISKEKLLPPSRMQSPRRRQGGKS